MARRTRSREVWMRPKEGGDALRRRRVRKQFTQRELGLLVGCSHAMIGLLERDGSNVVTTEAEKRSAYTAGLRAFADALDANPELPLPYHGADAGLLVILHREADQRAALRQYARAFDGAAEKGYRDSAFDLHGTFCG